MNTSDILSAIAIIFVLIVGCVVFYNLIPAAYNEIHSYHIMQTECEANPDICFCASGSCSMKSICSYTRINNEPEIGGCNYTKICEIVTNANWKQGIWEYECKQ